ncbi:DUF6402 family protein [Paraburkholderia sp. MMS20-SJTR3]|uniref:DUF6402 family protein n=1 Tax=Paraburkholderia sejongensis TaxID=2886946 RepID=A0ABS8JYT0_9BURK|nr:DUF6402 family protein [Paraburkholderia sp. MMS20-SJTR3]MCC8394858.1 DUF6402 family protein [Paraburkholderia sp. MMS20-SJTR3]
MNDDNIPYYKVNKLIWTWSRRDGAEGCRAVREAELSMERPPPLLEKAATEAPVVEEKPSTPSKLPTPAASQPEKPKKTEMVPPFDIQDIPEAMRKLKMPVSAKLMERWFAGRLNYSPGDSDESNEINQDGKPYPPDMYDATTVKMDWILKFPRAKKQFDYLIGEAIRSPAAKKVLADKLKRFDKKMFGISTRWVSKDNTAHLHKHFHFQHVPVDGEFSQKIQTLLASQWKRSGVPDDLAGALGSFNIYAAIGSVRPSDDFMRRETAFELTGIWVYVKDNYTFTDQTHNRSQYLGHWSRNGVVVVPLDVVAAASRYAPYVESPVTLGNPAIRGNVYYPIHNSDFRQWALKHQRGGDFVIYSDRCFVPVVPPIRIDL